MKKTKKLFVMAFSMLMLASCGEETSSSSKENGIPASSVTGQSSKEDVTLSSASTSSESSEQSGDSQPSSSEEPSEEEIRKNAFDNNKMENYTCSVFLEKPL